MLDHSHYMRRIYELLVLVRSNTRHHVSMGQWHWNRPCMPCNVRLAPGTTESMRRIPSPVSWNQRVMGLLVHDAYYQFDVLITPDVANSRLEDLMLGPQTRAIAVEYANHHQSPDRGMASGRANSLENASGRLVV